MANPSGHDADPAGLPRRDRRGPPPFALAVILLLASVAALAFVLGSNGNAPTSAVASASLTGTASSSQQVADFRFLPALAGRSAAPTPAVTPAPSPRPAGPAIAYAVGLVQQADAPTARAQVELTWKRVDGKPLPDGATIEAGLDRGQLRKVSVVPNARHLFRSVQTGVDYVYRLAFSASAGQPAPVATSFRLRMIDDAAAAVSYDGSWKVAGFGGYLGGRAAYSSVPGSAAVLVFTGRSVAWVGPVGPGRGSAIVSVDGANPVRVSLSAATFHARRDLFVRSWPDSGRHELRITVAGRAGGAIAVDSFTVVGPPDHPLVQPGPGPSPSPYPTPTPTPALPNATLPLRAAFYYGWYPEGWPASTGEPAASAHPSAGVYDSSDPAILAGQIAAMRYGGIQAGIASWWGPATRTDGRISQLLAAARGTGIAWAIDDELETVSDPDVATIRAALEYVGTRYATDPSYLRTGGRFVVFVGAGAGDGCDSVSRWTEANSMQAYLVFAAVPGYAGCASQPDDWYAADPTLAQQQIGQSSYSISPGFQRLGEPARLERDPARWAANVKAMIASGARFQLIGSFNQWRDGSSVESATEWASGSGFGLYLDALHTAGLATGGPGGSGGPPSGGKGDAVLVGAGAIASCASANDEATAEILSTVPGTVFTVGDHAYPSGTANEFAACYGASWGVVRDRTRPAVGTRDYVTADAAGYFGYFGAAAGAPDKGYYAYNLGTWRIYVLNSNCAKVGGCGKGSPQEFWLRADLRAHPDACIGAYWQTARFSSGRFADDVRMEPFWADLYASGAEFVINGHDHNYQRYAPLTPAGKVDRATGIREFIVGTGGNGHTALSTAGAENREAGSDQAYGVLRLTLHPTGYEWQFLATPKAPFTDSGAESCH